MSLGVESFLRRKKEFNVWFRVNSVEIRDEEKTSFALLDSIIGNIPSNVGGM
jgi:hypothetical protein